MNFNDPKENNQTSTPPPQQPSSTQPSTSPTPRPDMDSTSISQKSINSDDLSSRDENSFTK